MCGFGQSELRNPATHCIINIAGFSEDFHGHFSQNFDSKSIVGKTFGFHICISQEEKIAFIKIFEYYIVMYKSIFCGSRTINGVYSLGIINMRRNDYEGTGIKAVGECV